MRLSNLLQVRERKGQGQTGLLSSKAPVGFGHLVVSFNYEISFHSADLSEPLGSLVFVLSSEHLGCLQMFFFVVVVLKNQYGCKYFANRLIYFAICTYITLK